MFEVLLLILCLAAQSLGELLTVPDQQLLLRLHRLHGVEVDVLAVLAGHQVLFGQRARRVDETHPVAVAHVMAVDKVEKLTPGVNLFRGNDRERMAEDTEKKREEEEDLMSKTDQTNSMRFTHITVLPFY